MKAPTAHLLILVLTLLTVLSGCAPLHRTVEYTATGAADPRGDAEIKANFVAERENPLPAEAEAVTVLIDTVPEGISLEDGVLGVEDGYQHQIVGKFKVGPDAGFFPAYKEGWRKGVCYWQQPLVVATLFIWMLVPTYYPCYVTHALPKIEMVDALKRVAYEAGGDMVVATYLQENQDKAMTAVGFIIQADPRMMAGKEVVPEEADEPEEDAESSEEEDAGE
jgi:hypothetical protein